MSEWAAKRFWTKAEARPVEGGFDVTLDGRPLRTPFKSALILPSQAMAEAIAVEWDAQEETIDPLSMPVTRSANSAIDKVAPQHAEVSAMLAGYAETDLLCHRAADPRGLADRQQEGWGPLLNWAAARYGAPLTVTVGILPADQPAASLQAYAQAVAGYAPFSLTALHDLITLSGSLVLGLAVAEGERAAETAWDLSRIDEIWQIEHWGEDEEATEMALEKRGAFLHAARFLTLSNGA